jgi:hypothetical protein
LVALLGAYDYEGSDPNFFGKNFVRPKVSNAVRSVAPAHPSAGNEGDSATSTTNHSHRKRSDAQGKVEPIG